MSLYDIFRHIDRRAQVKKLQKRGVSVSIPNSFRPYPPNRVTPCPEQQKTQPKQIIPSNLLDKD